MFSDRSHVQDERFHGERPESDAPPFGEFEQSISDRRPYPMARAGFLPFGALTGGRAALSATADTLLLPQGSCRFKLMQLHTLLLRRRRCFGGRLGDFLSRWRNFKAFERHNGGTGIIDMVARTGEHLS